MISPSRVVVVVFPFVPVTPNMSASVTRQAVSTSLQTGKRRDSASFIMGISGEITGDGTTMSTPSSSEFSWLPNTNLTPARCSAGHGSSVQSMSFLSLRITAPP